MATIVLDQEQIKFPSAQSVFATASKRFLSKLSQDDRMAFEALESADDMVGSIEQYIERLNSQRNSRLLGACQKISQFGRAVAPFFKIIDIFVSSHPDWAAIFWGAIRMVFQLSSHFADFFEKLAEMFAGFTRALPDYHIQFEIIRKRFEECRKRNGFEEAWRATHECFIKSLSHVYVDILQFCHDACRLFSKKKRGVRYKAAVIWDLFWTPFDERFSEILSRMRRHRLEFESGLRNVYSEEILGHFSAMDQERERNAKHRLQFADQQETAELKAIDEKLLRLQAWIMAPNWTTVFDVAKGKRWLESGRWLLEKADFLDGSGDSVSAHKIYQDWLAQTVPFPSQGSIFAKNMLIISAKPGYGKTVLSTVLIEALRARNSPFSRPGTESCVAYYYFDQQQADRHSRITALRCIAAQLLHSQRRNKTFIDLASMMAMDEGQGQMVASESTLQTLIRIYVEQLDSCYLVIDGLDECAEWDEFLISLRKCTEDTSCKIAILTRPHLFVSSIIGQNPFHIRLEGNENLDDIRSFLRPGIETLIKQSKLGKRYTRERANTVVNSLARRADSIFLWAELMLKYLSSVTLTPNDRARIIEEEMPFQGLEKLYENIIQELEKRVPRSEHTKVKTIFQWLVVLQQPWTLKMLETALVVQQGRSSTQDDYTEDFEWALLQLCGPLVEAGSQGLVRFIHLSVAEYLIQQNEGMAMSPFKVELSDAHYSMAIMSLLYLFHEVSRGPLTGDHEIAAHGPSLATKYCLLEYAVTNWSRHSCLSLEIPLSLARKDDSRPESASLKPYSRLFDCLSRLVADKLVVTLWIEASWVFEAPPTLLELPYQISEAAEYVGSHRNSRIDILGETLKRLSKNLSLLNKDWGHVLALEPNEIWLPSMNSLTDSEFWIGTKDAKVSWLDCPEERRSVLLVSQVSDDGKEIGVVKVWPSSPSLPTKQSFTGSFVSAKHLPIHRNWVVAYQIWCIDKKYSPYLKKNARFEILDENILREYPRSPKTFGEDETPKPQEFRFPVALSPSLREAFIMGTVIQMSPDLPNDVHGQYTVEPLLDPRCPYSPGEDALLQYPHKPQYFSGKANAVYPDFANVNSEGGVLKSKCHNWLRCCFSPNERFMYVVKGDRPPCAAAIFSSWILQIYQKSQLGAEPAYELVARTGVRLNGQAAHALIFHPIRPAVAISMLSITGIWQFLENEEKFTTLYKYPLDHMIFSDCGNFLQGVSLGSGGGEPVFLNIAPLLCQEVHLLPTPTVDQTIPGNSCSDIESRTVNGDTQSSVLQATQRTQVSGIPKFSHSQGQLQISALTNDHDRSAVFKQTMRSDGKMIEETLLRLPKSSTLEQSYSSLVATDDDDQNIRLVLNMAIQNTYSATTQPDFQLPAILDRSKEMIPLQVYTPQQKTLYGANLNKRCIQDLEDDSTPIILASKKRR